MANQQFDERSIVASYNAFTSTYTPGTVTTVTTNTLRDLRIDALLVENTDTADATMTLYMSIGGTPTEIAQVTIPAGSGTAATPLKDVLAALFPTGYQQLLLPANQLLAVSFAAAPAAGRRYTVLVLGGTL